VKDQGRHFGIFSTAVAVGSLALAGCGAPRPIEAPTPISLGDCRQDVPLNTYRDSLRPDKGSTYEATTSKGKQITIDVINDKNSQSLIVGGASTGLHPILHNSRQYIVGSVEEGIVFNFITESIDSDNQVTYTAEITCID
jgi:hypothetical protein